LPASGFELDRENGFANFLFENLKASGNIAYEKQNGGCFIFNVS
jgi:hypothetical protein